MMLLSYIVLALLTISVNAQKGGLTVNTQQGVVEGTLVDPSVRRFLGIPYATAQRWEAPSLPPKRAGIFKATNFSDSCVQQLDASAVEFLRLAGAGNDIVVPESENCLSVNIWAPAVNRKQKTAVMLWVYGGSFVFGTSNQGSYDGEFIVRDNEDVTIVTFNYRLNIFGQPNAPQLLSPTKSQNFGMLDLDAAVQWVFDNIAAFGGDPNRITLFGQSAGSAAIDAFTFAHPNDHRVKGVIEQSGTVTILNVVGSNATTPAQSLNATSWNTVANAVGCGSDATAAQFACMKKVPFRTLENAVISTAATFAPVVDDINVFGDVAARATAGNFLHVPLLSGSTKNEMDIFVVIAELLANGTVIPGVTEIESDALTLPVFTCPAGVAAVARKNAGVPAWRYQYQAIFPDLSTIPELRAYHASDIPLVFATFNFSAFQIPPTANEIALSKFMQSAWVTFARNPQEGLLSLGWPQYDPNTASLVQLGNPMNQTGTVFGVGAVTDAQCPTPV